MQIQLRVRTNDVSEDRKNCQMAQDAFVLYDNCSEIKYGKPVFLTKDEFINNTLQYDSEARNPKNHNWCHAETLERFDDIIFMIRDAETVTEIKGKSIGSNVLSSGDVNTVLATGKSLCCSNPKLWHYNVVEWKDRTTNKRYRIIFDTIVFINDDNGKTLRKVEG